MAPAAHTHTGVVAAEQTPPTAVSSGKAAQGHSVATYDIYIHQTPERMRVFYLNRKALGLLFVGIDKEEGLETCRQIIDCQLLQLLTEPLSQYPHSLMAYVAALGCLFYIAGDIDREHYKGKLRMRLQETELEVAPTVACGKKLVECYHVVSRLCFLLLLSGKKRQNHIFSTNITSYTCFTKKGLSFEAM